MICSVFVLCVLCVLCVLVHIVLGSESTLGLAWAPRAGESSRDGHELVDLQEHIHFVLNTHDILRKCFNVV